MPNSARTQSDKGGSTSALCEHTTDVRGVNVKSEQLPVTSVSPLTSPERKYPGERTCLERSLGGGTMTMGGGLRFASGLTKGASTPRRILCWRAHVGRLGSTDCLSKEPERMDRRSVGDSLSHRSAMYLESAQDASLQEDGGGEVCEYLGGGGCGLPPDSMSGRNHGTRDMGVRHTSGKSAACAEEVMHIVRQYKTIVKVASQVRWVRREDDAHIAHNDVVWQYIGGPLIVAQMLTASWRMLINAVQVHSTRTCAGRALAQTNSARYAMGTSTKTRTELAPRNTDAPGTDNPEYFAATMFHEANKMIRT